MNTKTDGGGAMPPAKSGTISIGMYRRAKVAVWHWIKSGQTACGKGEKTLNRWTDMSPEDVAKSTELCRNCRDQLLAAKLIKEPQRAESKP